MVLGHPAPTLSCKSQMHLGSHLTPTLSLGTHRHSHPSSLKAQSLATPALCPKTRVRRHRVIHHTRHLPVPVDLNLLGNQLCSYLTPTLSLGAREQEKT